MHYCWLSQTVDNKSDGLIANHATRLNSGVVTIDPETGLLYTGDFHHALCIETIR